MKTKEYCDVGTGCGDKTTGVVTKAALAFFLAMTLTGCISGGPLLDANSPVPEGMSLLRCGQFQADANGTFTHADSEGFSCIQSGDALSGDIDIETEQFKVRIAAPRSVEGE